MTIVQHQLTQPRNGASINGAAVTIRLVGNGYTASGHTEIMQTTTIHTKAGGMWSIDLVPQSQIDPTGTHYEVTHPDGEVLSFVVSDATGPLWLRSLLVNNPASPSPVFAGPLSDVAATVTANGALTIGVHNPVDATSGNRSMTLANAARGGQYVSVSKTDATTNTVTLTLNLRGTPASTLTLTLTNEGILLESKSDGSWWPISDHKTLGSLNGIYAQLNAPATFTTAAPQTHRAPVYIRHDEAVLPLTQGVILKPSGDATVAPWWLIHDDKNGYLIHMGSGPNFGVGYNGSDGLAYLGMGTSAGDQFGANILVDNRGGAGVSGPGTVGIVVTNFPTTSNNGVTLFQQGTAGRNNTMLGLYQLANSGSPLLGMTTSGGAVAGVGQQYAWVVDAGGIGDAGEIRADTGEINWLRNIRTKGSKIAALPALGDTNISKVEIAAQPGGRPAFRDGNITQGSTTLTSATATFTSGDTGKNIWGGGIPPGTTITFVNSTTVTLSLAATVTSTACEFYINRSPGQYVPGIYWYSDDGTHQTAYATRMVAGPGSQAIQLASASVNASPGNETYDVVYMTAFHIGATPYLSFYGAGVTARQTRPGQLTDSTGGTVSSTLAAGITDTVAKNAIASLAAKVNSLETILHTLGLIT